MKLSKIILWRIQEQGGASKLTKLEIMLLKMALAEIQLKI